MSMARLLLQRRGGSQRFTVKHYGTDVPEVTVGRTSGSTLNRYRTLNIPTHLANQKSYRLVSFQAIETRNWDINALTFLMWTKRRILSYTRGW